MPVIGRGKPEMLETMVVEKERLDIGACDPDLGIESADFIQKDGAEFRIKVGNGLVKEKDGEHVRAGGNSAGICENNRDEKRLLFTG